ncbi:MAG: hypothetical protein DME72_08050 [Verrucomicrobia bacterium]|nr:MAG: hypothetical protein DME72_08050 [Verrucomicrobiota bacterium]
MKYLFMLMSIFAVSGAITGRADDVLPPRFNFNRYSAMVDHSPFAIATAVALPSATADFAKDLYVANAARSPEGDMVTIASSSDQNFKKYLSTRQPVDGYSIASIEWSDRVGATKVTISKDGKFATITFNQAAYRSRTGCTLHSFSLGSAFSSTEGASTSCAWNDSAKSKDCASTDPKSPAATGGTVESDQPRRLQPPPQSSSVVSGFRSGPAENRS